MPLPLADLEDQPAEAVLRWASEQFADAVALATAFNPEDCVLLHMIASAKLPIRLFTLDTGLLFADTYALWRRLEARYGVTVQAIAPAQTVDEQQVSDGPELWNRDPERCCERRKVAPLTTALQTLRAWVTGIRREQTPERAHVRVVAHDERFGLVKINPLATWSSERVWDFVSQHDIPTNALHAHGYTSIGCVPCTTPTTDAEDPRAGRWRGQTRKECGLHCAHTENKP